MVKEYDEFENEIEELSKKIDRLKFLYDQYFMGFEKIEPSILRSQIDRSIKYSHLHNLRKTVFRIKFLSVVQRFRTYCALWDRILREMENGIHRKDAYFKAIKGTKSHRDKSEEDKIKMLFNEYIEAKKNNNESIVKISFEKFKQSILKSKEEHKKKFSVEDIIFTVSIKNSRVILLAKPEKS